MKKEKHVGGATGAAKKAMKIDEIRESGHQISKGRGRQKTSLPLVPKVNDKSSYRRAFELAKRGIRDKNVASMLWESHKAGEARATYALATWFLHGIHFKINQKKAVTLLRSAGKKGIPEAVFDLAVSYERGIGVPKSSVKAAKLYIKAALDGDRQAIDEVVRCVFYGIGIQKNRALAFLIRDMSSYL